MARSRRRPRDPREASPTQEVDRARRRDCPPGPGDKMGINEVSAMKGTSSTSARQISLSLPSQQQLSPDEGLVRLPIYSDSDDSDSDDTDGYMGGDSDDPHPRDPNGQNRTTIGFEFEHLVAVSRIDHECPDPHPGETRWLSQNLINQLPGSPPFAYTVRNRIIDELRAKGVAAKKTEEPSFEASWDYVDEEYANMDRLEWWNSLEYENPNSNDGWVRNWSGVYNWDSFLSSEDNICEAVKILRQQFLQYHIDNNLYIHLTRYVTLDSVLENVRGFINGAANNIDRERIATLWYEQTNLWLSKHKEKHYSASQDVVDPDCLAHPRTKKIYLAWTCTDDLTIFEKMPSSSDYTIQPEGLPINPVTGEPFYFPPGLYKWFNAEIRSSILDYDHANTFPTLNRVCKTLRDTFRIHKPMTEVHTGVHIHIGQERGWTLLHLKKFATLWHLIEESLYKLHRNDRTNAFWCKPLATATGLADYVFRRQKLCRRYTARTNEPQRSAYGAQMALYVPDGLPPQLQEYFHNIWQYETINNLNDAMQARTGKGSTRWRLEGGKRTLKAEGIRIQTLEFRLLQGTLDADHIWKWAGICERLVIFARDSTAEVFRAVLESIMDETLPDELGLNKTDLRWFTQRRTNNGYFAYPDPDGKVDWGQQFMVPGSGDTHNLVSPIQI
ncbi:hypothetical protein F5Y19DRAFT_483846 [Xylariaceae sp. FL1651]|nr:hypothetical protein F5Y19DRAFT_483846 [Xylariaceae sp. FL1651]